MALVARKLISYESTRFCRMTSPCRFCEFLWEGLKCSKFSAKTVADWMFTRLGYMLVSVLPIATVLHPTKKHASPHFPRDFGTLLASLHLIPAPMCVWNQPESIGFPYSTSWRKPAMLFLLTPSTRNRKKETKQTERMLNGYATCSCAI